MKDFGDDVTVGYMKTHLEKVLNAGLVVLRPLKIPGLNPGVFGKEPRLKTLMVKTALDVYPVRLWLQQLEGYCLAQEIDVVIVKRSEKEPYVLNSLNEKFKELVTILKGLESNDLAGLVFEAAAVIGVSNKSMFHSGNAFTIAFQTVREAGEMLEELISRLEAGTAYTMN